MPIVVWVQSQGFGDGDGDQKKTHITRNSIDAYYVAINYYL